MPKPKSNGVDSHLIEEVDNELRIRGRALSKGRAEGPVIKSMSPLSLTRDVSLESSAITDRQHPLYEEAIKDRVLVFPYVEEADRHHGTFKQLKEKGLLPRALVAETLDVVIAQDLMEAEVPGVDRVDISLLETGDNVLVDGTNGFVGLRDVTVKHVVTSVLTHENLILVLKRSEGVSTHKGRWACVSGYIEKGEVADETALREILEEVGLSRDDHEFIRKGEVVYARDEGTIWAVHPFLFSIKKLDINLDWEHDECKWISPQDIRDYDTVPKLREAIESVLHEDQ